MFLGGTKPRRAGMTYRQWSRRKLGPKRRIIGESMVWTSGGYALFEVLSCGHIRPLVHGDDGMPTCWTRCCVQCLSGPRKAWSPPSGNLWSDNWYEEEIAWGRAPTMVPYPGYELGQGPKGERLLQMRAVHELMLL